MVMRAVRTDQMRCSNFVSFRRYLIRRHSHRPTPGFDPVADVIRVRSTRAGASAQQTFVSTLETNKNCVRADIGSE